MGKGIQDLAAKGEEDFAAKGGKDLAAKGEEDFCCTLPTDTPAQDRLSPGHLSARLLSQPTCVAPWPHVNLTLLLSLLLPQDPMQGDLAYAALTCLGAFVEWPNMAPFLSPDVCANIFKVGPVNHAAHWTTAGCLPAGFIREGLTWRMTLSGLGASPCRTDCASGLSPRTRTTRPQGLRTRGHQRLDRGKAG